MEFAVCGVIPNYIGIDGWDGKTNQNENRIKNENYKSHHFMCNVILFGADTETKQ